MEQHNKLIEFTYETFSIKNNIIIHSVSSSVSFISLKRNNDLFHPAGPIRNNSYERANMYKVITITN